jgi:hypothetical protein
MGIPTSEVSYTLATTRRGDHEDHKGHVFARGGGIPETANLQQHNLILQSYRILHCVCVCVQDTKTETMTEGN